MLKSLPSLSDPKSPAAVVTGMRMKRMPAFPSWGAMPMHRKMGPLPSLCDEKMSNPAYKGGTN